MSLPGYKRDSEVHIRTLNSKGGGICVPACLVLRVHIPRLPSTPSTQSPDSQVGLPDEPKTLQQEEASVPPGGEQKFLAAQGLAASATVSQLQTHMYYVHFTHFTSPKRNPSFKRLHDKCLQQSSLTLLQLHGATNQSRIQTQG